MAEKTPTIELRCSPGIGCVPHGEPFHVAVMRRLSCNPKGFWTTWQREVLDPQRDWRVSARELVLTAQVKCVTGLHNVQVLVDTGARIPLFFAKVSSRKVRSGKLLSPLNLLWPMGKQ